MGGRCQLALVDCDMGEFGPVVGSETGTGLVLRPPQPGDATALATIVVAGWRAAYRGILDAAFIDSPSFELERHEQWRAWLAPTKPATPGLIVADDSGTVVGWVRFGAPRQPVADPTLGELWGLYVDPNRWGTSAATELMTCALREMSKLGYVEIRLWVLTENPRARAFYEKTGWRYTGADRARDFGKAGTASEVEMSQAL